MGLVVGLLEPFGRHVSIRLSRSEVSVTEKFLNTSQIRAGIEQVSGVAVTQFVGRQVRVQASYGEILF